ncbi:MAG: hypothetical protein IPN34_12675 [Planctomycetes bacterium]|nr:hypothetical protein [Planctomycetota bacterium]
MLERTALTELSYKLVDVLGRGVTTVLGQIVFLQPPPQIVPATPLLTVPGAVDLAVAEPFLYVASNSGGASTVVEYDLASGTQRVIGSYVDVRSVAVSPFGGELTLGLENGDLQRIAVANGAMLGTTSTGLGPLISVGYTRFGTLV